LVHESKREFFSPLGRKHFAETYNRFGQGSVISNDAPTGPYTGSFPSRYETPQTLAKWTPQVNRTFEIAPAIEMPKIDWESVESANAPNSIDLPGGKTAYRVRIDGPRVTGASQAIGMVNSDLSVFRSPYQQVLPYGMQMSSPQGNQHFLTAATAPAAEQRSSLQFQRSPLGLGRLDDLPFVDSTVEGQGALLLWTQDGVGNFTIYRKPLSPAASKETPIP
jgi:hypothetical protein